MKSVVIVFPHQIFKESLFLSQFDDFVLIEESLFFLQYNFHKQKLAYQRAFMKFYESFLCAQNKNVKYINAKDSQADLNVLLYELSKSYQKIHCYELVDNWLEKKVKKACKASNIEIEFYRTPNFLNTQEYNTSYFNSKKKLLHADFYTHQRINHTVLIDSSHAPIGGKWSFDDENRLKYPKNAALPAAYEFKENEFYTEACSYVVSNFENNIGSISEKQIFPITFQESESFLLDFLGRKFENFGVYEDAIVSQALLLNHSGISAALNYGLLSPQFIINTALQFQDKVPFNSLEGFVRQILGWREFVRGMYEHKGVFQRNANFWRFQKPLSLKFWSATTGILPVDETIKKVLNHGYCHHIERLMILGNFMLLCEFAPDAVYQWFMEMYIDALDWVMVPNVYGMSQFADGGLMCTKPYISGSAYVCKMSNYPKGEWCEIWDALFWRFIYKNKSTIQKNHRLAMMVSVWDKMPAPKQNQHLMVAENYLQNL